MTNVEPRFGRILTQHERGQRRLSFMLLVAAMGRFAASVGPGGPVQTAVAVRVCLRWLSRCRPRPCPFRRPSMAGGRRVGGTSYRHPAPAEARTGRAEPPPCSKTPASLGVFAQDGCRRYSHCHHFARKRRPPVPFSSVVVVLAHSAPIRPNPPAKSSTAGAIAPTTRQNATAADRSGASRGSEAAHPPPSPKNTGQTTSLEAAAGKRARQPTAPAHPPIKAVWTGPGGRDPNPRTPPPAATLPQRPPALAPSAAQPGAAHRSSSRPSRQTTSASAHVRPNRATMK